MSTVLPQIIPPQTQDPLHQIGEMINMREAIQQMQQRGIAIGRQQDLNKVLKTVNWKDEDDIINKLAPIDPKIAQEAVATKRQADLLGAQASSAHFDAALKKTEAQKKLFESWQGYYQSLKEKPETADVLMKHLAPVFQQQAVEHELPPQFAPTDMSSFENIMDITRRYDIANSVMEHKKKELENQEAEQKLQFAKTEEVRRTAEESRKAEEAAAKSEAGSVEMKSYMVEQAPTFQNQDGTPKTYAQLTAGDKQVIRDRFQQTKTNPSDMEEYARLYTKVQNGTATPEEQTRLKGMERRLTLAGAANFARTNPSGTQDRIGMLADIAEQRGLDAATKLVTGVTEKNQLTDELSRRGSNVFKSMADIQKVTGQAATFTNVHNNIAEVRRLLPVIKKNPTLISLALEPPETVKGQQLQGKIVNNQLSASELNLVYAIRTLREDLFGLRQFFGNSPVRSNSQVQIMLGQIPNEALLTTGDPQKIDVALQQLERSIAPIEKSFGKFTTLQRGGVSPSVSPSATPGAPSIGGKSLKDMSIDELFRSLSTTPGAP